MRGRDWESRGWFDLCLFHGSIYFCLLSSKESFMVKQRHLEKAQGLTEYAMILVLVAIVVIVTMQLIGPTIGNVFSEIIEHLQF